MPVDVVCKARTNIRCLPTVLHEEEDCFFRKLTRSAGDDDVQGRPPENVSLWHIGQFELTLLKNSWGKEGHSDPPLSP